MLPHSSAATLSQPETLRPRDELLAVNVAAPAVAERLAPRRSGVWQGCRRAGQAVYAASGWLFGAASLLGGLALLATIPGLQFLSLGYLLEVSGRVARSGRLRDAFVGVRKASYLGSIVVCVWLLLWPLRLASTMWTSARLIDPSSPAARGWGWAVAGLSLLLAGHVVGALLRGGRARSFFIPRPFKLLRAIVDRRTYPRAVDAVWELVAGLRLPYYFWLGLRGFLGAAIWLVRPVSLMVAATRLPGGAGMIAGLAGSLLLAFAIVHLPLMQARFAAENRFACLLSPQENRRLFARAPIAYWFGVLLTLSLAVPLYLLKIELVPREAAWLPALLFVMSGFPARVLSGWACGRALRRPQPRHWAWRWLGRGAMAPVAAAYVLLVFFTQFLSWHGIWSLYEQHAVMLPVPFVSF